MDQGELFILLGSANKVMRPKAVNNTLIGRKTVSNLYWAFQYGILKYFNSFHGYSFGDVFDAVNNLSEMGFVNIDGDSSYWLTTSGEAKQQRLFNMIPSDKFLVVAGKYDILRFSRRFILATQVVSEFSFDNVKYYPQTTGFLDDQLIKKWFGNNKNSNLIRVFHDDLQSFITNLDNELWAEIFTNSLVGHSFSGLTDDQLAQKYNLGPIIVQTIWLQLYAMLFMQIKNAKTTDLFLPLTNGLERRQISNSAQLTFEMYLKNPRVPTSELADIRHIKETTVREHLLEAAIYLPKAEFPFQQFISENKLAKLANLKIDNWVEVRFDSVTRQIDNLNFFEFRLYQILRSKE